MSANSANRTGNFSTLQNGNSHFRYDLAPEAMPSTVESVFNPQQNYVYRQARYFRALEFAREGNYDAAIRDLEEIICSNSVNNRDREAILLLCDCALQAGNPRLALFNASLGLHHYPDDRDFESYQTQASCSIQDRPKKTNLLGRFK